MSKEDCPNIEFFIDKKFVEEDVNLPGYPASYIFNSRNLERYRRTTVIVCIGDAITNESVCKQLSDWGYVQVYSMYDFKEFHCAYDTRDYTEIGREIVNLQQSFPNFPEKMFADDESIKVFFAFLSIFQENRKPSVPMSPKRFEQLEPSINFFNPKQEMIHLLSAGAYDGEIVSRITTLFPAVAGTVYLCEPNKTNFIRTVFSNITLPKKLRRVFIPVALDDKFGTVEIKASGVTSRMSEEIREDGERTSVTKVPLDYLIDEMGLSHLVIDVEGNELAVLSGAKKLIYQSTPNICISVYHFPVDIFRIPSLIREILPTYKLYLRNYSGFASDTLLYAVH
jgi:FkbM family methyltransferase